MGSRASRVESPQWSSSHKAHVAQQTFARDPPAMPEQMKKCRVPESEALRQRGNARYKASKAEGLPSIVVAARAAEALQLYNKAEGASSCPAETASACKNIARAAIWLVQLGSDSFESLKYHAIQVSSTSRLRGIFIYHRILLPAALHCSKRRPTYAKGESRCLTT